MMTHVDEGELLTLMDGELSTERAGVVNHHLEECADCREELELIRSAARSFSGALAGTDAPVPVVSETTARALRRHGASRPVRSWKDLSRAAVLVIGFAAAASATIPGSPVNRWVRDLADTSPRAAVEERVEEAPVMAAHTEAVEFVPEAGVSVLPEGGVVQVVLREATADLRVKAVLVEQSRAGVYAVGAAADARFSTAPGRIEVVGAAGGELRIELPHSARAATVDVNGRRYISKEGDQLRLTVPAEDSAGAEVSFRVLQ